MNNFVNVNSIPLDIITCLDLSSIPTKLDLKDNTITFDDLKIIISLLEKHHVEEIDLRNCALTDNNIVQLSCHLASVKTLLLSYNNITDIGVDKLCDALSTNCNIEKLFLAGHNMNIKSALAISRLIRDNSSLKSVYLSYNNFNHESNSQIIKSLSTNIHIKELFYRGNNLGHNFEDFAYLLIRNHTISLLNIGRNAIDDNFIEHVCGTLNKTTHLISLNLSKNLITIIGAKYLADILKKNATLKTLNLRENKLKNEGAQYIAEGLAENNQLETINIGANEISDTGFLSIVHHLKNNTGLKILDCRDNHVTDLSLEEMLKFANGIEILDLRNNNIKGIIDITLLDNVNLKSIDLRGNPIDKKQATILSKYPYILLDAEVFISSSEILNLQNKQITDQMLESFFIKHGDIVAINLEHNLLTHKGAEFLALLLQNNIKLKSLNLKNNKLGPNGAKLIISALYNSNIEFVDLSYNNLPDEITQDLITRYKLKRTIWKF